MSQATFVSRLPCELLDNIFQLAVTADVSPFILSHVSSHWRNRTIHNNPIIWSRLFISLGNCLCQPGCIDLINPFIERSGHQPLHIIIHAGPAADSGQYDQKLPQLGPQILSFLLQAASRWQTLDTHKIFLKYAPFPPNIWLPLLEKLLIRGYCQLSEPLSAFLRAPNLRFLDTEWSLGGGFEIPWSQIQYARIILKNFQAKHEQMTRLETLHIHKYSLRDSEVLYPLRIVELPTVLRLTIHMFNHQLMRHFKFNNLISLELCCSFRDSLPPRLTAFISKYIALGRIGSSLRHLSTHFSPSSPSQFKELLQQLPCLETLSLFCSQTSEFINFPEACACFFRDLSAANSSLLTPKLAQLTLRGVPFLGQDFQAFIASRGPSLHVSIIFTTNDSTVDFKQFRVHDAFMYQWVLSAWLSIRPHLRELHSSGQIRLHVEGEERMLEEWGTNPPNRHKAKLLDSF